MAETSSTAVQTMADELFDKYLLPKIALAVILLSSLIGTLVSVRLMSSWDLVFALVKWAYFVSLGTLTGSLLWKHAFVRPADFDTAAEEYCDRMYDRFDRIAAGSVVVLAASTPVVFRWYLSLDLSPTLALGSLAVVLGLVMLTTGTTVRSRPASGQFRSTLGLAALAAAVLAVSATAFLDVLVAERGAVAFVVRTLHLVAFSVWVGGAVWNIFVAVPSGQDRPTSPVIQAAGEQLERFRWAVRFVFPTILLTGFYQSYDAFGFDVSSYLGTAAGLAIVAKLAFIVVLFGIFLACPMWRACSPIDGVCDLEEMAPEPGATTNAGCGVDD